MDPSYAPASTFIGAIRSYQWVAGAALTEEEIAEAVNLARHAIETEDNDSDVLSRSALALTMLAGEHAGRSALWEEPRRSIPTRRAPGV